MTAPSDIEVLRPAFDDAFRGVIEKHRLETRVRLWHGMYIRVVASSRDGAGIEVGWVGERDAELRCEVHLPRKGFFSRREVFHISEIGEVLGIYEPTWELPPFEIKEAARRLRVIGDLYSPLIDEVLSGRRDFVPAVLERRWRFRNG